MSDLDAILCIDPGTTHSAWVVLERGRPTRFGIDTNEHLLHMLEVLPAPDAVVIEKVESFGMAVGAEVFETVRWAGRFEQAAQPAPVHRIGRKAVKLHVCGTTKAKDPNIRAALIDRFGGPDAIKRGGVLYGVKADCWAALAVGLTWWDQRAEAAA